MAWHIPFVCIDSSSAPNGVRIQRKEEMSVPLDTSKPIINRWDDIGTRWSIFQLNQHVLILVTWWKEQIPWWRHQMETFSALLDLCAGNSPVPGEFPAKRPVTRSFDVFFDLRLNKRLSKQRWGCWFEMLSRPLWRHRNAWMSLCELVPIGPILLGKQRLSKAS